MQHKKQNIQQNLLTSKRMGFQDWRMVEDFYVKFGDPNCSCFWDIVRQSRQID